MDAEGLRRASQVFEVFQDNVKTAPEAVSFIMDSEVELDRLRAEELSERNNYAFLTEFVGALPQAKDHAVLADSAREARQVQRHLLWVRQRTGLDEAEKYLPYYVIGACPATEDEYAKHKTQSTHLLLFSASAFEVRNSSALIAMTVREDEFLTAQQIAQDRSLHSFGDRLDKMFDKESLKLAGRATDAESTRTRMIGDIYDVSPNRKPAEISRRITARGLYITNVRQYRSTISDEDLTRFSVFERLNYLAVDFERSDNYLALFEKYTKEAEKITQGDIS